MSKLGDQPGRLPAGSRVEQDLSQYADLSDEELEAILKGQKEDPTVEEDEDDDAEEAEEEDKPAEEEEENSDEEDDEEDAEAAKPDADGAEESDELSPIEKRMMLLERRLEKEGLERERETERRKRAEMLASKQAGRAGYYKQAAEKAGAAKPEADGEEEPGWVDGEEKPAAKEGDEQPNLPPHWEEDRAESVLQTINDEGGKFTAERADEFQKFDDPEEAKEFYARFTELIEEEAGPYRQDFATSSLKSVRKLARSIMTSAFATAKIEYADKVGEKATVRKAESAAKNKRRKKKAAISKSGAPSKPKSGAKSYTEMSDEELEAEFQAEFGENYNARRDSLQ
jgi:hypothetical protein